MENQTKTTECLYEFARFRLLPAERLLLRDETSVQLAPKVFDTLLMLVERGGHLVEKDELLDKIWADAFVEEATLARNISILRKVLGGNENGQKFIETVPKRGYRFVEPVRRLTAEKTSALPVPAIKKSSSEEDENFARLKTRRPVFWLTLAFIAVVGLFTSWSFWTAKPENSVGVKSIAVLPFKTIGSPAERDQSLELGMADAVIARLVKVRQIVVRPTSRVSKYLEIDGDPVQAGRDLQTEAVLEGTIQRADDRLRVSARLVKTEDGAQLWTETFDAKSTDIFSVQDSISEQIVQSLNLKLSEGEQNSIRRRETPNAEAYQFYIKGRYFLTRPSPNNLRKAVDYFTQAIILDTGFADAYAALAEAYATQVSHAAVSPQENLPKARNAVEKALQIDDQLPDAHASHGYILWLSWDWPRAEKELNRSLELNPNASRTYCWYSALLSTMERHEEAITTARRAVELDPTSVVASQSLERAFYFARRYDEAIAVSQQTLELNSNANGINSWREMAFEQKGMYDQAIETRLKAMSLIGVEAHRIENPRRIYREAGWQAFWQQEIEYMKAMQAAQKYVLPYNVARNYARAGDKAEALAWLEKCADEHSDHLTLLKIDPIFDPLRDDPRFAALLARVGLN
jgi:DNA-binding winged helix-turn-helix (wHTH) protein/TolB-like protein/Tfp pilus assembly protein PilF